MTEEQKPKNRGGRPPKKKPPLSPQRLKELKDEARDAVWEDLPSILTQLSKQAKEGDRQAGIAVADFLLKDERLDTAVDPIKDLISDFRSSTAADIAAMDTSEGAGAVHSAEPAPGVDHREGESGEELPAPERDLQAVGPDRLQALAEPEDGSPSPSEGEAGDGWSPGG